ncbi:MAG: ABC transporter permease [Erysipelotrichaceae bacterium]|nr:ABC transporter permease [Erysipelotrichaceae bacterium]
MRNKPGFKVFLSSLLAIAVGLLVGFIIIMVTNPSQGIRAFVILAQGGFYKGLRSTGDVLYYAVPIMMTGLAVAFAFKCGNFNIGVTGQYTMGAFTALFLAIKLEGVIPSSILWIICLIAAAAAGALWAFISAVLKAYKNVNVVISGIMLNYIGMLLTVDWVKRFIFDQSKARSYTANIAVPKFGLDKIFSGSSINGGTIIAILVCILAWYILNKTTFGYELKACGHNVDASKYAGMNEKTCTIMSMLLAGAFAGLGGGLTYIAGSGKALAITETTLAEGFNGIPVALLGANSPLGCIAASIFIAYIDLGGTYMQACNIPVEIIDVIVAVIIYFSSFSLLIKSVLDQFMEKHPSKNDQKQIENNEGGSE